MKWNLILDGPGDPAYNMGLDEALLNARIEERIPVTVRIYSWSPPAITLGYSKELENELDLDECRKRGVVAIRRITGGGAVLHEHEATYSVIAPVSHFGDNITESYRYVSKALIAALKRLGLAAEFAPVNDVLVSGRKISGSAQIRRGDTVLQHGTILIKTDIEKMFSLLRIPDGKLRRKSIAAASDRVTSLEKELDREISYDEVESALKSGFEVLLGAGPDAYELDEDILTQARFLAERKFCSDEWNYDRRLPRAAF